MDTAPEAMELQGNIYKHMTPVKRLEVAQNFSRTMRKLLSRGVRSRHPEYSKEQARLATIRLLLPEDLYNAAYPQAKDILP